MWQSLCGRTVLRAIQTQACGAKSYILSPQAPFLDYQTAQRVGIMMASRVAPLLPCPHALGVGQMTVCFAASPLVATPLVATALTTASFFKGLFEKEGKNYVGDFQVEERQGNSYSLRKPDGSLLSNGYRPYELRKVPEGKFTLEKQAYHEEQQQQEANKKAKNVARKVRQEVGKEPAAPRPRAERPRQAPEKPVVAKQQLKKSVEKQADAVDVPMKILDHDWGAGKKPESLRFPIQWKATPAFRGKWGQSKALVQRWDDSVIASWQPGTALTQRGVTNAVVDAYLKTLKDKQQRLDIEKKMGLI